MKILLAVEGVSDVRRVKILVDCWLADNVDWFSLEHPDACREFVGLDGKSEFVQIKSIPHERRGMPKKIPGGRFGGAHPAGDAGTLKDLRILMVHHEIDVDVVIWIRDTDGRGERRVQVDTYLREQREQRFIAGYAQQTGEAWVLVGWVAEDAKWAVRRLGLAGERERAALLRAWRLDDSLVDECGLAAFRRDLNRHAGLRRALGLAPVAGPGLD